jgi:endonuclease YncB( thermonuclease family)
MLGGMSKPWKRRSVESLARRRALAWLPSLATLALGFALVLAYSQSPRSGGGAAAGGAAGGAVLVEDIGAVRVIDGDTIRYRGDRIRIADINTPEVSRPACASEAELGARATERMEELLAAGPFTLLPSADGRDEDVYGRKLRIVARDGRSLGSTLVEEGLAHEWRGYKQSWCDG